MARVPLELEASGSATSGWRRTSAFPLRTSTSSRRRSTSSSRRRPREAGGRDRRVEAVGRSPRPEGHDAWVRGRSRRDGAHSHRGAEHRGRAMRWTRTTRTFGRTKLLPDTATARDGELEPRRRPCHRLARGVRHAAPRLLRGDDPRAGARYRGAAPEALVAYGTKAFPNVAILRVLAEEGSARTSRRSASSSFAEGAASRPRAARRPRQQQEGRLARARGRGGCATSSSTRRTSSSGRRGGRPARPRARHAGDRGRHARGDPTGHHGSKFGLPPEEAIDAIAAHVLGLDVAGLHIHLGSQLSRRRRAEDAPRLARRFSVAAGARLGAGGGRLRRRARDPLCGGARRARRSPSSVGDCSSGRDCVHGLAQPRLILEPGRSLVGQAGVTLYRVGSVEAAARGRRGSAVDGGISDNPRPRSTARATTALVANRAGDPTDRELRRVRAPLRVGGHAHRRVALAAPRRGDLLAVPATGAYTLSMGSNYNAVPRPAAVLVAAGERHG